MFTNKKGAMGFWCLLVQGPTTKEFLRCFFFKAHACEEQLRPRGQILSDPQKIFLKS